MLNNKKMNISRLNTVFLLFAIICLLDGKDINHASHTISIVIPKIALLDIESVNTNNITLQMISPIETGDHLISATDNNIWLNVSSVIESGKARDITVKLDEPVQGIDLRVASDIYSGSGYGEWGTPQPEISLSQYDQLLVSNLKSGITGNGTFNGFNLRYLAQSIDSDYENINSTMGKDITVTYTLTH